MKKIAIALVIIVLLLNVVDVVKTIEKPQQPIIVEREMTVDDVVSVAGTDYFIVKEIDTWALLEEDVYMDRPVMEINICDDTEDTLCLFIDLANNEEPHIKQW